MTNIFLMETTKRLTRNSFILFMNIVLTIFIVEKIIETDYGSAKAI